MEVVLIAVQANGAAKAVPLNRPRTVVGRQTDCHLRIPVGEVSRNHCEILVAADRVEIADMGARNGTWVNGERVERRVLKAGDLIAVGPAAFVVQIDGDPAESDLDPAAMYEEAQPASDEDNQAPARNAGGKGEAAAAAGGGGLLGDLGGDFDPDSSSVADFDFDLEDDEDDQPPL